MPIKAAEKELRHHIKDVEGARKTLKKDAGELKSQIGKKITGALKQDHRVMADLKKAKGKR